jgi:signal transduction histidine kinase
VTHFPDTRILDATRFRNRVFPRAGCGRTTLRLGSAFPAVDVVVFSARVLMDLTSLSPEQLSRSLEALQRTTVGHSHGSDELQELVQELHVHRIELEMQNRALRETQVDLESALHRYTDLYDHLPIGYVTVTPQGRIVHANLTAAGWLRRDRSSLIGGYMNWFFDAFDAGRFTAHLEGCMQSRSESLLDIKLRLDSGLVMTVQLFSRRSPEDAEPVIHTAITNIAKLKQAQDILGDITREQQTLHDAIAEDVRAPVETISSFAHAILNTHGDGLKPEIKSMVERMEGAAVRMEAMLHQMLDYSCFGADEISLDPVSVEDLLQNLMLEHRAIIQRRRAEILIERPLPCVRGSRLILAQVLANVLTHALKVAPEAEVPKLRIAAQRRDHVVLLTIGQGIERRGDSLSKDGPAQQFRRFERQVNGGMDPSSGLALAVIRRAIQRMHGRAWLEADSASGTCFHLELPAV